MRKPKHSDLCVRCGSKRAFYVSTDGVRCPACGLRVRTDGKGMLTMSAEDYDSLVDHRYGRNATSALRRLPQTPLAKKFHGVWNQKEYAGVLPALLANRFNFPNGEMTERDAAVVGQFVQWLGSPAGQHYLYECGYKPAEEIDSERR